MDITSRLEFPAAPADVFALLVNRDFLIDVCRAGGATAHDVRVEGQRTISQRTLPAPDMAKTFTGPTISITEDITWGEAKADGGRVGDLVLTVDGQPARMTGTVTLAPNGGGSTITVNGDLKVSIPLVGKKLEKSAAPAIYDGIKVQQDVGIRWLTGERA
ncbi:DUF2505 domain-containing protein [Enemella sp. A6]|uniref:DUF2505 domain-containing protein n=1 Tax=Enemella sp. A6 TaxID=3440152 RepID=UPI003EBAAE4E